MSCARLPQPSRAATHILRSTAILAALALIGATGVALEPTSTSAAPAAFANEPGPLALAPRSAGHSGTALAAPAASAIAPQAAAGDRLTLDQYLRMQQVRSPQISPDGRQIIFSRSYIDAVNDKRQSEIWLMNADGSRKRKLLKGSSPIWSPDGTRIAYLAEGEPRGTQIWVRWMDAEGAASQITHLQETPAAIRWSPDSTQIAFTMLVPPSDNEWRITLPSRPEGVKWTKDPRIVARAVYRRDRRGFLDDGKRHIFLVSADGGPVRRVSKGDYDYGAPAWSPDGDTLYFSALLEEDAEYQWRESEIYALDIASSKTRQLTTRHGPDRGPLVSPDGRRIAYSGYDWVKQTYIESQLYVMNADGSNPRSLTADFDRSPSLNRWAADGSGVYFQVSERGSRNLYFASLNGEPRKLTDGTHVLNISSMTDHGIAVGTLTTYQEPPNVVKLDVRTPGDITRLTDVNRNLLAGRKLGEVEEIWYKSTGDLDIQGWIIKPPDFDPARKYPLILSIHGGPHGMYNVGFNFGWQNHAANDYVVLYTNPRGSSGYGTDFGNAINRAYPGKDFDDLMNGVDTVVAKGYIDERNMYVYGCSGGGVLTAWVVGHTGRFAAASSNCPVIDWLSFVGTTDGISWYRNFDNYPWEDASEYLQRSPLMYVDKVTTPTMLMTGVNDLRTPISQTAEFYAALKVLKVPTAMIRFNDEFHGTTSKPSNFLRTQLYLRHWFERHMTDDAAPKLLQRRLTEDGS
ncbi:MAG: S9 family peptidase [Acidobacteriota bacterium]